MPVESYSWRDGKGGEREEFSWDSLLERLQDLRDDENQFGLEIHRDQNDGRSFSPEAIEQVARAAMTFVLARCDAYWKREHEPPSRLKLVFSIALDHEHPEGEH